MASLEQKLVVAEELLRSRDKELSRQFEEHRLEVARLQSLAVSHQPVENLVDKVIISCVGKVFQNRCRQQLSELLQLQLLNHDNEFCN